MRHKVLALDLSVRATGWACGFVDGTPITGVVRFAPEHSRPAKVWFEAFKWLMETIEVMRPDIVAIEAAIPGTGIQDGDGRPISNAHTHGQLWGLQSTCQLVAESRFERGILNRPAMLVHESSAKKTLTGKGRWPKKEGKEAVKQRCIELGWLDPGVSGFDRSDACAVWAHACCTIDKKFAANFTLLGTSARVAEPVPEF